jgi:hypothetical protein
MSDKSPLFVSASELLAHAIELYFEGTERKYKFVILHLANAIELILKDRIIDSGSSIYKSSSTTTISIWDAFTILDKAGVNTQERPIIELLIDDRNTIRHRFGFPNGDACSIIWIRFCDSSSGFSRLNTRWMLSSCCGCM